VAILVLFLVGERRVRGEIAHRTDVFAGVEAEPEKTREVRGWFETRGILGTGFLSIKDSDRGVEIVAFSGRSRDESGLRKQSTEPRVMITNII
jgi:hypothetical protein